MQNLRNAPSRLYSWGQEAYLNRVNALFRYLNPKYHLLAGALATFLVEPWQGIKAGYYMMRPLDPSRFKNLNLKQLSPTQQKTSFVVLLHGDGSKASIFKPMISAINQAHPEKPIFAFDIATEDGTMKRKKHLDAVFEQLKQVLALYPQNALPPITLIGHSSGGDFIAPLAEKLWKANINPQITAIKIGSLFKNTCKGNHTLSKALFFGRSTNPNFIEIVGKQDVLEGRVSYMANQIHIPTGHVGLLFHPETLSKVNQLIS